MACQAGKHVYCEKPLSHTIEEGRRMVEAARRYNRIFQTGSQQRSAPHYAKIVELIRNGYIGSVAMVECWNMMNEFPEGQGSPADSDPPPGLNWDMFLGPAPKRPYNRNRFIYTFRQFWDYAGSMMADWGAHHMDIIHWAMGVDAPKNVTAVGGKFVMTDDRETPDTLYLPLYQQPAAFRPAVRHRLLRDTGDSGGGPQQLRDLSGDAP
jgi:predicted dehydrogenase